MTPPLKRCAYAFLALVLGLSYGCSKEDHIVGPGSPVTISAPVMPSGNTIASPGGASTYTTGGSTCSNNDPVEYRFDFDADLGHRYSAWGSSQQGTTWPTDGVGIYQVAAQARCKLHPGVISVWSAPLTVVIPGETITAPSEPAGPETSIQGRQDIYQTGGSISSVPDTLEYRFDFDAAGAHDYSAWSLATQAVHTWASGGTLVVKAQARSLNRAHVVSNWSSGLSVNVAPSETISTPSAPAGSTVALSGDSKSYTTGGAVSSLGHSLEYRFLVHDLGADEPDSTTEWSPTPTLVRTWDAAGTFLLKAQARCSLHHQVVSFWSAGLEVTVSPSGAIVITSGKLVLTSTSGDPLVPLVLRSVQGPWDESSLTWAGMPAVSDSMAGAHYEFTCGDDECYPVAQFAMPTDLLQSWLDHSAENDGLAIGPGSAASEDISFIDRSSGYLPPYVQVIWHYEGEALQRARYVALSEDAWTDEAQPTANHEGTLGLVAGRASGTEQVIFVKFPLSLSSSPAIVLRSPMPGALSRRK